MDFQTPLGTLDHLGGLVAFIFLTTLWAALTYRSPERRVLWAAWGVKVIACLLLCYMTYYDLFKGSDIIGYHESGVTYSEWLRRDLFDNSNEYFSRPTFYLPSGTNTDRCRSLSGFVHLLTCDSLLGASLVFTATGFAGQVLIYKAFTRLMPDPRLRRWWQFGILFMPSLTFWSSGLLKDPIGLFGLGLTFLGLTRFLERSSWRSVFLTVAGLYTLLLYRSPLVPVFLLASAPLLIAKPSRSRPAGARGSSRAWRVAAFAGGFIVISTLSRIDSRLGVDTVSDSMLQERSRYALVKGGSTVGDLKLADGVNVTEGSSLRLLGLMPEAVTFTLCRPFPWESTDSPIIVLASAENSLLLALVGSLAVRTLLRPGRLTSLVSEPLFWTCVIVTVVFAFALGVSTPNFGTVSRYRMPLMPFFWGAIVVVRANLLPRCRPEARSVPARASTRFVAADRPPSRRSVLRAIPEVEGTS